MLCLDHLIKIVDNKLKKSWDIFTRKPHLEWAWMGWPESGEMDKKGRSLGHWLGAGPVTTGHQGQEEGRTQPREEMQEGMWYFLLCPQLRVNKQAGPS